MFTPDVFTDKELIYAPAGAIGNPAAVPVPDQAALKRGEVFSDAVEKGFVSDFEKDGDKMVHVSTFTFMKGCIFMTYYANTMGAEEDPLYQRARLVYCKKDDTAHKTFLDVQAVGDECGGGTVQMLYDTILMPWDDDTLYVLWTANVSGNYYRLVRPFYLSTMSFGEIKVNRFKVGDVINDFSTTGIKAALAANGIPCKTMYSDIGIMQKLSFRMENGEKVYYSGAYSGDFNCIIKSRDFVTWEYVSQPDFPNQSKWENAVYVADDVCYYFVRQQESGYGFLTAYELNTGRWRKPVLIGDCQSRSDFIMKDGELYLFHAPVDREHIGVVKIDRKNLANSRIVVQAHIKSSCFYPFVQYGDDGKLYMSYTVERKHIRLAEIRL